MYDHIGDELVDSGLANEREVDAWIDIGGNIVQESNAFGCKVEHNIDKPDWVLVMGEVGGNTNQNGDGNVGGELQRCERGKITQRKINAKYKHYTVLVLTAIY